MGETDVCLRDVWEERGRDENGNRTVCALIVREIVKLKNRYERTSSAWVCGQSSCLCLCFLTWSLSFLTFCLCNKPPKSA